MDGSDDFNPFPEVEPPGGFSGIFFKIFYLKLL
jgi:hypothetical protein